MLPQCWLLSCPVWSGTMCLVKWTSVCFLWSSETPDPGLAPDWVVIKGPHLRDHRNAVSHRYHSCPYCSLNFLTDCPSLVFFPLAASTHALKLFSFPIVTSFWPSPQRICSLALPFFSFNRHELMFFFPSHFPFYLSYVVNLTCEGLRGIWTVFVHLSVSRAAAELGLTPHLSSASQTPWSRLACEMACTLGLVILISLNLIMVTWFALQILKSDCLTFFLKSLPEWKQYYGCVIFTLALSENTFAKEAPHDIIV